MNIVVRAYVLILLSAAVATAAVLLFGCGTHTVVTPDPAKGPGR